MLHPGRLVIPEPEEDIAASPLDQDVAPAFAAITRAEESDDEAEAACSAMKAAWRFAQEGGAPISLPAGLDADRLDLAEAMLVAGTAGSPHRKATRGVARAVLATLEGLDRHAVDPHRLDAVRGVATKWVEQVDLPPAGVQRVG